MIAVFALTCFVAVFLLWSKHFGERRAGAAVAKGWRRTCATSSKGTPPIYYDKSLVLFSQGFTQGRYHFAVDGALYSRWESQCISQ